MQQPRGTYIRRAEWWVTSARRHLVGSSPSFDQTYHRWSVGYHKEQSSAFTLRGDERVNDVLSLTARRR